MGGSTGSPSGGSLWLVLLLGLFVILGVGGIALLAGRRTAEEEPMELAGEGLGAEGGASTVASDNGAGRANEATTAAATAAAVEPSAFAARVNEQADTGPPPPPPRPWDAYRSLDDEPIGTVDQVLIDAQPRPWDAQAPRPQPPEQDEA